jgi:hypothetical protein
MAADEVDLDPLLVRAPLLLCTFRQQGVGVLLQ